MKKIFVLLIILVIISIPTLFAGGNSEEVSERGIDGADTDNFQEVDIRMKEILNARLTDVELQVIENKGTEYAFTGEYDKHYEDGIYVCRRCGEPLYNSTSKFDSGCGWPAFDDEIEGAVLKRTDADGRRTEILCSTCEAHLGHVFTGEGFTDTNTRHCVNSVSMRFIPAAGETGRAVFAGGCFWGVEYFFSKVDGVLGTTVGYTGGEKAYPTYKEVSYTETGHVEAIEVLYDPAVTDYETLARLFFETHDPTQENGQGPDIGSQYLSVVYYENETQKQTIERLTGLLEDNGYDVATTLEQAVAFWPAEDYHQDYYDNKGTLPYCHGYVKRF
ncbi:MAG: bifunctional methionine sulfoxide reductase B/A protein [Spirochaetales bacterium]|nr:bifunctional methionine sulfoxide reductase B/A protein [Spirochaetales bacterium]